MGVSRNRRAWAKLAMLALTLIVVSNIIDLIFYNISNKQGGRQSLHNQKKINSQHQPRLRKNGLIQKKHPKFEPFRYSFEDNNNLGYFNLSCPFEWSKYSCAYMQRGPQSVEVVRASTEYYLDHLPQIQEAFDRIISTTNSNNGNTNNNNNNDPKKNNPKRIFFTGDSLMRQLFVGIACNAWSLQTNVIEEAAIPWKDEWPCANNAPCFINHGPHGGFDAASIRLINGMELHFVPHNGFADEDTSEADVLERLQTEMESQGKITFGTKTAKRMPRDAHVDVLVYNVGIHGHLSVLKDRLRQFGYNVSRPLMQEDWTTESDLANYNQSSASIATTARQQRTKTIYVTTPTQHFNTINGQWKYQMSKKEKECVNIAKRNPRAELENQILTPGDNVDVIVNYDDLDLGMLHIRKFHDCSHYCMPGVPDVVGARLLHEFV